jgi:ATP/maltotriose-dependent transcriptional regulator MalT
MAEPSFDLVAANRWFAVECYNRTWALMDNPSRAPSDDEEMIQLALASAWHWTQRPDRTDENASISCWQIARVYTLVGQIENARRYGLMCLAVSQREGVAPFYLGYAYEALARVEAVSGNRGKAEEFIAQARRILNQVSDPEEKQMLSADLDTI